MKNIHEIEVEFKGKKWEEAIDKAFNVAKDKVTIPGFRKGKVTKEVFIKKYGKESLYYDAINALLSVEYPKVLKDNKLEPIINPNIDVLEVCDDCCKVKFTITTRPEVKIKKYKDLKVKKDEVKVSKEEIDEEVKNLQARMADIVIKEGKIENGDIAIIDFEGFKDGVAFEGGKGENYSLTIGSNSFIPGFEEGLIGLKSGDDKDLKLTFPENYHSEELKGQKVVFKVKVHEVKTKKLPELNEDFFLDLGMEGVKDEKSLKDVIKDQISARKEYEADNKYIDALLEEISKNTEVEIPNELVEEEIDKMIEEYSRNLQMQGMSLDAYYKYTNSTEDALREQMRNDASIRVKYRFMLEEIVKLEDIKVTKKEIDEEIKKAAKAYNIPEEEFKEHIGGTDMIEYELQMRKAIDVIKK
ncbi:MAG: trigger factor [Bacilli bacterium]|nr:trigger factor [Bacilli bacterium]